MIVGFYQVNSEVLKFDRCKDVEKIMFNHYIIQKENLQRVKHDLPRGQFYLTTRNISNDLMISLSKAQRLIKEFMRIKIIEIVKLGGKDRTPSIYAYITSKGNTVTETVFDTIFDTVKPNNINILENVSDTTLDTVIDTEMDTSKKENLIKELNKNIKIEQEETVLQDELKLLYMAYIDAKGFITKGCKLELYKLLKLYSKELIIKAIEEMTLRADTPNLQYVITTLNDWSSRGLIH